ncbi:MAG: hypothetical protein EP329_23855 [Deltaproteobacteria bacterium]|nr:MAG: hypothetical protein EP329_23855 [Deltaproteobacteria bacterium]
MRGLRPRSALGALLALGLAAGTALAAAPGGFGVGALGDARLLGTPEEQEALQSDEAGKYIRAREQAEKILATDPRSIIATWVLADVFHEEEANHARALFLVRKARRLLTDAYGEAPTDAQAQIWHKRIMMKEIWILGEMDRKEVQLRAIDAYDRLYAPKLTRLRIWPLMKLGRYDEAREVGLELTRSADADERVSAYNGLMALEDELLDRTASYTWGKAGIDSVQGTSCILFHNTAQAAIARFRFEEGEELARKAIRAERNDCPNSSYEHLANLYLVEGAFQKTISAFKKLVRAPIDRRYRPQFVMGNRAILVELLYALGRGADGLPFAKQVFNAPDRTGMTSVSKDDIRFGHAVALWQMLDLRIQEVLEQSSVRGLFSAGDLAMDARDMRLEQWELERILLTLSLRDEILVTNLRPYLRGVKPWYAGNLARILGPGLVEAALERARKLDAPQVGTEAAGYYDAMLGELRHLSGDREEAVRLGRKALEAMPKETRLLRWRTVTWLGVDELALGETAAGLGHLREALQQYPSAFKQLDLRVPVAIYHDEQPFSRAVAERLAESRRLEPGRDDAFRVDVSFGDAEVKVCLAASDGFRFGCATAPVDKAGEDDVVAACDAFHGELFSPKVELTSSDINSLDGSTVRVNAGQVLDGLLGRPKKDGEEDE